MLLKILFLAVWWSILVYCSWFFYLHALVATCKIERRVCLISIIFVFCLLLWPIDSGLLQTVLLILLCVVSAPLLFITTFFISLPLLLEWSIKVVCFIGRMFAVWLPLAIYNHFDDTLFLSVTLICLAAFAWYHFSYPGIRYSRLPMLHKTLNRVILFLVVNDFSVRFAVVILFLVFVGVALVYDLVVHPNNVLDTVLEWPVLTLFGLQCVVTAVILTVWWVYGLPCSPFELSDDPLDEIFGDGEGDR